MSLDARARRAAQAARTSVDRLAPPPIGVLVGRRRRRAVAANALALAVVVAVGGVAWRVLPIGGPEPTTTGLPRHVQAVIRVGKAPGAVLVGEGSVWVANRGDGTISRVDPATNRVVATITVGANPSRLTADAGAVWVATAEGLQRIDPATNQVVRTAPLRIGRGDLLAADGRLWASLEDGTVRRLDPADGRVLASIPAASEGAALLASGHGRLWASYGHVLVVAIDPHDDHVALRIPAVDIQNKQAVTQGSPLTGFVLVDGMAYRSSSDPPWGVTRFQVDPLKVVEREGMRLLSIQPVWAFETSGLAAGPTGVFAVSRTTQTLTRLEIFAGGAKAIIRLPGVSQLAAGADGVWATAESRGILYRIDPQATD
jgi:YVTN family beta-propeller protein